MAFATNESIELTYGETGLTDEALTQIAEDASTQVLLDRVPVAYQEMACRYFACHLIYIKQQQTGGDVTTKMVGTLKIQKTAYQGLKGRFNDRWEQSYQSLLDKIMNGPQTDSFAVWY